MTNKTMNALVNITVCPRCPGTDDVCTKCSYKNRAKCYESLTADSSSVLREHFIKQNTIEKAPLNYNVIISDILRDIGIPANVLGYEYLREAVIAAITNRKDAMQTTKWLYPTVAKKFDTTGPRVERAMRHAVEVAFDRANYDALVRYFGNTVNAKTGRLTNTEFIFGIADYIKLKYPAE